MPERYIDLWGKYILPEEPTAIKAGLNGEIILDYFAPTEYWDGIAPLDSIIVSPTFLTPGEGDRALEILEMHLFALASRLNRTVISLVEPTTAKGQQFCTRKLVPRARYNFLPKPVDRIYYYKLYEPAQSLTNVGYEPLKRSVI